MEYKNHLEFFDEIAATSSRNDKKKLLQSLTESDSEFNLTARNILRAAYDPSVVYYVKKYKQPKIHTGETSLDSALSRLSNLSGRVLTGNDAIRYVELLLIRLSEPNAEILKRILAGNLKCGINSSSINDAIPGLIYSHPYMRCSKLTKDSKVFYPCFSQIKMDGLYADCIISENGDFKFVSRSGKEITFEDDANFKKTIKKSGLRSIVLSGEIVCCDSNGGQLPRKESNGYANSGETLASRMVFYVWDQIPYKDFLKKKYDRRYFDRWADVDESINKINSTHFQEVDTDICYSSKDAVAHAQALIACGCEGSVIKNYDGLWKSHTSPNQFKVKLEFSSDLKIVDLVEGEGKFEGTLGAIVCETSCGGLRVSVGTGFSDKERDSIWAEREALINDSTVMEVIANDIMVSQNDKKIPSLFLPVAGEIRRDKLTADSLSEVYQNFEGAKQSLELLIS